MHESVRPKSSVQYLGIILVLVQLMRRFLKMCRTMYQSSNESVKFIMKHCMNAGNCIIDKNLFYVCSQFDCNITEVFNSKLCFIKTEVANVNCILFMLNNYK